MRDDVTSPSLYAGSLEAADLAAFFGDLREVAHLIDLRMKHASDAHSHEAATALDGVHRALKDGTALGAQIRYRHAGREWIDTVLRRGDGFELVRVEVPSKHGAHDSSRG